MSEDKPVEALVQFRASDELVKRINELAAADDRSRSSWLRRTLDQITRMRQTQVAP
jgi:predicted transcriptional regulator